MYVTNKVIIYTFLTFLVLAGFIYSVSPIIAPFIVAIILGYFFEPLVRYFEKRKVPRTIGSIITILLLIAFLVLISLTIGPILYKQSLILIGKALDNKDYLQGIMPALVEKIKTYDPNFANNIQNYLSDFSIKILNFFGSIMTNIVNSGVAAANIISLVFITPIVLFYCLRDWENIKSHINSLIPKGFQVKTKTLMRQLDLTLAGYIRGQTYVCLIMGMFYAVSFTIIGLDSGAALGVVAGLLTFIPYAGALFSCALSIIVGIIQFGLLKNVLIILLVFIVGQLLENNIIVPKFVGDNINVHPVWIMFGLLAGGTLFGFVGVLIALPLTAVLSVLIRFLLTDYKNSLFYKEG